jgi:hypothetical protein
VAQTYGFAHRASRLQSAGIETSIFAVDLDRFDSEACR